MFDALSNWPALGAAGEQAWQALRQHTEWTEGFWLAWLFTGYPPMVHELETRMEGFLHERAQRQVVLRPGTPEEARNLLEAILAEDTCTAHCVWVEIIHSDALGLAGEESPGPWTEAWDWLMMRANERRTALSKHLPGGLVFVGSPMFKDRARRAAPDLWSIRALVLEPVPPEIHSMSGSFDVFVDFPEPEQPREEPDAELALEQAARMRGLGSRADECKALMRAARGLLARGETAEALQTASEAVDISGEDVERKARALALLSQVEVKHGDPVAAERHLRLALGLMEERDDLFVLGWMRRYGWLLRRRGDWSHAEQVNLVQAGRAGERLRRDPGDVDALRERMSALNSIGWARVRMRRHKEAAAAFTEASQLGAESLATLDSGKLTSIISSMAESSVGQGAASLRLGDIDAAERFARTALLFTNVGPAVGGEADTRAQAMAQANRYEALHLLGVALVARGDREEAERTFREAVQAAPEAVVGRSVMRARQASSYRVLALLAAQRKSYGEALGYAERGLELDRLRYDDSARNNLRKSLELVARLRRANGDEAGARAAEAELAALPQPGSDS